MAPGQLTPGILASEYGERRQALVDSLPQNSIAIIAAAPGQFMAGNIPYPYRQVRLGKIDDAMCCSPNKSLFLFY